MDEVPYLRALFAHLVMLLYRAGVTDVAYLHRMLDEAVESARSQV